jgi:hypothetical protein
VRNDNSTNTYLCWLKKVLDIHKATGDTMIVKTIRSILSVAIQEFMAGVSLSVRTTDASYGRSQPRPPF